MWSRRSSRRPRVERSAGFTLVELLVALGVAAVMLTSAVQLVSTQTRIARRHSFDLESQQAARSSLDSMTRDIRLAGACLPTDGEFTALDGSDSPTGDSITIRTGLADANMACIVTSLTVLAPNGSDTATVGSSAGFRAGMLGYVRHPNGAGQIVSIAAVSGATITFGTQLNQDYPVASGVYAVDERVYALDRSDPSLPVLTLTIDRGAPQQFAVGMQDLQISYVLQRNCPPCDHVDLPLDTPQWRLVNNVAVTTTVAIAPTTQKDAPPPLVTASMAKPRNLIP
jgi:prepilin-type N-terminal cleavage/methylation domain-containing protein